MIRGGKPFSGLQGLSYFGGIREHETAILVLDGRARMRYGEGLSRAVIARTDPNEQESVVLLDAQGRRS